MTTFPPAGESATSLDTAPAIKDTREPAPNAHRGTQGDLCVFCHRPLKQLYPDAVFRLQWGHMSREDAQACPLPLDMWPHPPQPTISSATLTRDYQPTPKENQ